MNHKLILIVFLFLFQIGQSRFRLHLTKRQVPPPEVKNNFTQQQYAFDQIIDHFNYQISQTYKQRYWVVNNYFTTKHGPVYIFLCGEWICGGIDESRQWILTLAQKTLGMVIILEHRFYGQSLPFAQNSFKIQNLKFLTSEQALSDTAYFIQKIQSNQMFGITNNPWIVVGGSYPGALSAWFRYKYPHLVIGAIASSAVVQAIQDFKDFDKQMYLSANKSGDYCPKAINESSLKVQKILYSSEGQNFKRQFNGGINLKNDEFLFYWIDAIVMKIQYGQRTTFCQKLLNKSTDDQFTFILQQVKQHQVYQYGSYYLKNDTIPAQTENDEIDRITSRAWYYQSCTQFGFWQTPSIYGLRSQKLNIDFYKRFCSDSYGNGTWPKVQRKNIETGGWFLGQTSNIFMVNGNEDPWKWSSILKRREDIIIREANCNDCAHVPELYTPKLDDPPQLKKIRDEQYLTIQEWLDQYWIKRSRRSKFAITSIGDK